MTEKLSPEQVEEMRTRYADGGVSQLSLSFDYDISQTQASRILRGEEWKTVPGKRTKDRCPGSRYREKDSPCCDEPRAGGCS